MTFLCLFSIWRTSGHSSEDAGTAFAVGATRRGNSSAGWRRLRRTRVLVSELEHTTLFVLLQLDTCHQGPVMPSYSCSSDELEDLEAPQ